MVVVEEHDLLVCPRCSAVFRTGFRACPRDGDLLVSTRADPLIGTVFADRYQIEEVIGEGGIGRVYRARHTRMSRRYAVKIPYGEVAYDPKVRARFANEAEAASRLSHPNVIGVVDFGETPTGLLYMAMDYAEGRSLGALIAETGPLARDWVIRFTREIAEGLAHAHDRGLIHRDLKPDNIIIEREGDNPRIVDFGLAILREQEGGRMTTQGTVLGTPHYMAPEQATGQDIDQRTDLFSLGLVMYEMMAGVLPFEGTPIQVARKNLSTPVPMIAERVPGLTVDPALEAVMHELLAKRPDDRPASAHVLIEMLDRLERGDTQTWKMDQQTPVPGLTTGEAPPASLRVEVAAPTPLAPAPAPVTPPGIGTEAAASPSPPPPEPPARTGAPTTDAISAQLTGTQRRRRLAVILALAVLVVALIGWKLSGNRHAGATVTADASRIAMVPIDASVAPIATDGAGSTIAGPDARGASGPPDARGIPDARGTIAIRPRPDARPPVLAHPDARVPATLDARVTTAPIDARVVAPPIDAPPIPQKTVTELYTRVGLAIDRLSAAKGVAVAAPFKKRYEDVPFNDGISNPALRGDVIKRLHALEKDLKAVP